MRTIGLLMVLLAFAGLSVLRPVFYRSACFWPMASLLSKELDPAAAEELSTLGLRLFAAGGALLVWAFPSSVDRASRRT